MTVLTKPQPIDQEYSFEDDTFIISKTDHRGVITYCNTTFIAISGYTEAELIGQPHNMIRHPDMPKAAFRSLWQTVKQGLEWRGIVKNICKDGGYYWVDATVTPSYQAQKLIGYMSVRRKPSRQQINEAQARYRQLLTQER